MNDTGFSSRPAALGARVFVAMLVFVAPILTIAWLAAVALHDALWEFFAEAVASSIFAPYAWALGSVVIVLAFAGSIGYATMLIARRRQPRQPGPSA